MSNKKKLREILSARRRQLSHNERQITANHAALVLLDAAIFQQSQYIAGYYPYKTEFDCLPIIEKIWQTNKFCYLPVLSGAQHPHLKFIRYEKETALQPNRYNIPEPMHGDTISPETLDLVLLPLLGFDLHGNRLGMGAGYYDRTFHMARQNKKPFLLGLAFEAQCVDDVPHDVWDVKLDGVLTEKGMICFNED